MCVNIHVCMHICTFYSDSFKREYTAEMMTLNVLREQHTVIKIRKLTLIQCHYLIYRPYSDFADFPNNVLYIKRKKFSGTRF